MAAAEAKPTSSPAAGAEAEGVLGRLSGLAWQALPAIGSAIGFAGFVAVIGSAIEWIRFDAAKLPATQAVLAVPHAELVFVGALALAAFVAAGLLAVLVVYLIDNNGNATVATVRAIVGVGLVEMGVTVAFINAGPWWTYLWLYLWLLLLGFVAADLAGEVVRNFRSRTKLKRAGAKLVEARDKLIAARVALATSDKIDEKRSTRETVEAKEKAQLALVSAQREWEQAIREWTAATKAVGGLPKRTRRAMKKARKVVGGYKDSPPDGDELDRRLAEAEKGTEHVVYAVRARLRVQVSHLRTISRIWMGLIATASKVLEGFEAASTWAGRLDAGKRRDARDRAQKATRPRRQAASRNPLNVVGSAAAGGKGMAADATKGKAAAVLTAIVCTVLGALLVTGIVFIAVEDLLSWFAIVFGVVVALTAMNVFVARVTEKFAWYGITVFFSVLIFGASLTIARTLDRPKAQPIALIRKGDDVGVCGVFVAQTSERVYVGRPSVKGRPGLIFWVPTSDVDLVSVGQPERTEEEFETLAVTMLERLYKDRAEAAGSALKNTTVTEVETEPKTVKTTTTAREQLPAATTEPPATASTGYPEEIPGKACTDPSTTTTKPS